MNSVLETNKTDTYKYLLPESYKGIRFDKFNKAYFNNSIELEKVIFSDELYKVTADALDNLSGLAFVYNDQVFFSIKGTELTSKNYEDFQNSISSFEKVIDFKTEGISNRNDIIVNYNENELIIMDQLYNGLYSIEEDNSIKSLEFDNIDYTQLMKMMLNSTDFESYIQHKEILTQYGKDKPILINIAYNEGKYYLGYYYATVNLEKTTNDAGEIVHNYSISNNYSYFILGKEQFDIKDFYNSTYTLDFLNDDYIYSMSDNIIGNKLYKLNQIIFDSKNKKHSTESSLFTVFEIDRNKKHIRFEKELNIPLFEFQKDTVFNNNYRINVIVFSTFKDKVILENFPYVTDISRNKSYKLEWDETTNKFGDKQEIKYRNIQLWEQGIFNRVLFKDENHFYLKDYSKDWTLNDSEQLFFNSKVIKDARFTRDYIYLLSNTDEIYRVKQGFN